MNPKLKRSQMIRGASGRYDEVIPVYGGRAYREKSVLGSSRAVGWPYLALNLQILRVMLTQKVISSSVSLCTRFDDPVCCKAEAVAEACARGEVVRGEVRDANKYDLVKVEMAASRRIADRYGVYALPAFLMFYKGSLVYAGQLGGEKIRVASEFKPYKMLYVEPTFRT